MAASSSVNVAGQPIKIRLPVSFTTNSVPSSYMSQRSPFWADLRISKCGVCRSPLAMQWKHQPA